MKDLTATFLKNPDDFCNKNQIVPDPATGIERAYDITRGFGPGIWVKIQDKQTEKKSNRFQFRLICPGGKKWSVLTPAIDKMFSLEERKNINKYKEMKYKDLKDHIIEAIWLPYIGEKEIKALNECGNTLMPIACQNKLYIFTIDMHGCALYIKSIADDKVNLRIYHIQSPDKLIKNGIINSDNKSNLFWYPWWKYSESDTENKAGIKTAKKKQKIVIGEQINAANFLVYEDKKWYICTQRQYARTDMSKDDNYPKFNYKKGGFEKNLIDMNNATFYENFSKHMAMESKTDPKASK